MLPLALTLLLVVFCLLALWAWPRGVRWRRARVRAQSFPPAWRDILRRRVPYVRGLPADLQLQLKKHIQVFLAEKPIIGCQGLVITDEIRVTIAAQACLLLLNRRTDYYPRLRQVLVYPGAFVVDRVHAAEAGVQHEQRQVLAGESWQQGQVILSWHDALEGAAVADDGHNVVIHEFAHQLDQENGPANGAPLLPRRAARARWAQVLAAAFDELRERTARGEPSLLDPYGATSPAEFFAVASEVFFERPRELAAQHPALFDELRGLYRINPLSW